jgi:hypothetical protein
VPPLQQQLQPHQQQQKQQRRGLAVLGCCRSPAGWCLCLFQPIRHQHQQLLRLVRAQYQRQHQHHQQQERQQQQQVTSPGSRAALCRSLLTKDLQQQRALAAPLLLRRLRLVLLRLRLVLLRLRLVLLPPAQQQEQVLNQQSQVHRDLQVHRQGCSSCRVVLQQEEPQQLLL